MLTSNVLLAAETDAIVMGAHSEIAERLGVDPAHRERASTLDYLVGATPACLAWPIRGDGGCQSVAASAAEMTPLRQEGIASGRAAASSPDDSCLSAAPP